MDLRPSTFPMLDQTASPRKVLGRNHKNLRVSTKPGRASVRRQKIALNQIKSLYSQRQFKHCLSSCTHHLAIETFSEPYIYKTFLLFYTAIAHEAIARNISSRSALKQSNLESAHAFYKAAIDSLPLYSPSRNISSSIDSSESALKDDIFDFSPKHVSPSSSISSLRSVAGSLSSSSSPSASNEPGCERLKPSPLKIRKNVRFADDQPPPPQSQTPREPQKAEEPQQITSPSCAQSTDTWLYLRAVSRYNSNMAELRTQLETHVLSVEGLIAKAKDECSSRANSRASRLVELQCAGYGENEVKETLRRERIEHGREIGWKRKRFDPERYQDLCRRALKEL